MDTPTTETTPTPYKVDIRPLHPYWSLLINEERDANGTAVSPHLLVYRSQTTSISSIGYRFAGVSLLSLIFVFFGFEFFWDWSFVYSSYFFFFNSENDYSFGLIFLFFFLLFYHSINGLRHVIFDWGYLLTWWKFIFSTYVLFLISALFAAYFWIFIF